MRQWWPVLAVVGLQGGEFDTGAIGVLHYEQEKIRGKEIVIPLLYRNDFADDVRDLLAFYSRIGLSYVEQTQTFGFNAEVASNLTLERSPFEVPYYLQAYAVEDVNTALLSMASVDYYADDFSVTLGRNRVSMPWLEGSIDTVMLYSENRFVALRAFWLMNYYDLQLNYFAHADRVGGGSGMYGFWAQSGDFFPWLHVTAFTYDVPGEWLTYGALLEGDVQMMAFHGSVTHSKRHEADGIHYENFLRAWASAGSTYDGAALKLGGSLTGEQGLSAMMRYGIQPFTDFYLNNGIARPDATNVFASLGYGGSKWYVEALYGWTHYTGQMIQNWRFVVETLRTEEVDVYLGLELFPWMGIELGWMRRNADGRDYADFSQEYLMANVMVSYP